MSLVVATDVASFLFKKDTRAALYTPHLSGHMLAISFQTLAELDLWALSAAWARAESSHAPSRLGNGAEHGAGSGGAEEREVK